MSTNSSIVNSIKLWAFPSLITILSAVIWHDVRSMQNDIKALLAQSNIDKTNIENVEQRVTNLEQVVFLSKIQKTGSNKSKPELMFSTLYAVIRPEDEEKKYLNF